MTQIKVRRDTAANWTSSNPILADGEAGLDKTNRIMKIGNGADTWSALTGYDVDGGPGGGGVNTGIVDAVNSVQSAVNTTSEVTLATLILPALSVEQADTDLWVKAMGIMRNNVTGIHSYLLRANGSIISQTSIQPTNSGSYRHWVFDINIANPTNHTQRTSTEASFPGTQGYDLVTTTPIVASFDFAGMHSTALDFSGAVTFTFSVIMTVADSTNGDDLYSARLGKILPLA